MMHLAIVIVTFALILCALLTAAASSTKTVRSHQGDRVAAWSKWMDTLAWWARASALLAFALLILLIVGLASGTS